MNFYEFPIPAQFNGDGIKAYIGANEVYVRGDKLIIGSDILTLEQVTTKLAGYVYTPPVDPNAAIKASIAAKRMSPTWIALTKEESDYLNSVRL